MAQDWWMFHANEEHNGNAAGTSSITSGNVGQLKLLKQVAVNLSVISIPTIVGGKIFVGTVTPQGSDTPGGSLFRIDLATGKVEQRFVVPTGVPAQPGSRVDGYQTTFNKQQPVNFIGTDNRVHELFFDNAWHHNDLTILTGRHPGAGKCTRWLRNLVQQPATRQLHRD